MNWEKPKRKCIWRGNSSVPFCVCAQSLSPVQLFVTPWTIACQAPLSIGFSQQEYWSGLPFPSPGDLLYSGIKPTPPAFAGKFFITEPPGKPNSILLMLRRRPWEIIIFFKVWKRWGYLERSMRRMSGKLFLSPENSGIQDDVQDKSAKVTGNDHH